MSKKWIKPPVRYPQNPYFENLEFEKYGGFEMKIKKLKIFKNIFSNWAKNAEFEFYTAFERRRGV